MLDKSWNLGNIYIIQGNTKYFCNTYNLGNIYLQDNWDINGYFQGYIYSIIREYIFITACKGFFIAMEGQCYQIKTLREGYDLWNRIMDK